MKKRFAFLMALAMLVSTMSVLALCTSAATPTVPKAPSNTGEVVFSTSPDDRYTAVGGVGEFSAVGDGNLTQIKRPSAGEISCVVEPAELINASGTDWLEFFIDISEYELAADAKWYFLFRIFDAAGGVCGHEGGESLEYALYQDGKWTTFNADEYSRIGLPAKFSGYIRLKLEPITKAHSTMAGGSKDLDLSQIANFTWWFGDGFEVGDSLYVSDFKFVKGDLKNASEEKPSPDTGSVVPAVCLVAVAAASAMVIFATKKKRG